MTDATWSDSNRNQINIAILGAISAGKSTLLNTFFANTYSDCKIKRTTMMPQIYLETEKMNTRAAKKIRETNSSVNKELIELSESGKQVTKEDIIEIQHLVPKIYDFLDLEKNIYLTIYDIPGLNDGRTKELYFEYINTNFNKFDIIIFVVDITSALNTSDEVDILENIITNCKNNYEKYDIHNKLIILANKCDEMSISDDGTLILEEDHEEMMSQLNKLVDEKIKGIFPSLEHEIKPISCEDSYIYRMFNRNPEFELDMKYLNKFGYNEYGKSKWNKLKESERRAKIKELLDDIDMEETMNITGFNGFKNLLNSYLTPVNQKVYINNHISQGLSKIIGNTKIDISEDIQLFYNFSQQYKSLEKRIKIGINTTKIFSNIITEYMETWNTTIIMGFIEIMAAFDPNTTPKWVLKQESFLPQIEEAKEIIDNARRLFNGDIPIIVELNNNITEALNNYYVSDINTKLKPVGSLFDHLSKLVKYGYTITKNLIDNLFNNQDMINQNPAQIIKYLETLEEDGFITSEEKKEKVLDILIDVYNYFSSTIVTNFPKYIETNDIYLYLYYANMFWTKYILSNEITSCEKINTLGFLSRFNEIKYMNIDIHKQNFNFKYKNSSFLLVLENYYLSRIESNDDEITSSNEESEESEESDGNSDELDSTLQVPPAKAKKIIRKKKN
jgi:predicted GTPase